MINLKQAVLQATDGGRKIFEDLYPDARDVFAKNGKGYIKLRNEKTASASFKLIEKNGESYWIVKDFGDDTTMNAIDAFMHENSIRFFSEAVHRLADIYNVSCELNGSVNKPRIQQRDAKPGEKVGDSKYETREITESELAIMGPVVTKEVMAQYKYYALAWYSRCSYSEDKKKNVVTTFYSTEDYPIFMHDCGAFQKIYKPYEVNKAMRFFSIGTKPLNYIFGLDEAKQKLKEAQKRYKDAKDMEPSWFGLSNDRPSLLDKIIICSGERDAMCLAGMGYTPIWFNSESAKKNQDDMTTLQSIADEIYNVPDSDDTGTDKGYELAREYPFIRTIELPAWLKQFKDSRLRPCKDLRDFIELRPSRTEFEKLLNTAQSARFWGFTPKGKVEINTLNLLFFLKINGFAKIKDDITKETKYVRVNGYTVTEYEPMQIRDFVRQSLREMQASNAVIETYINSRKTTKTLYEDLEPIDIDFESSNKDGRTLFFQNVCCSITENMPPEKEDKTVPEDRGINITYKPVNGKYVWDNKIIPHKFKRLKQAFTIDWKAETLMMNLDNNPSKVMRYLINASRLYWREEIELYNSPITDETERDKEQEVYIAANRFNLYGPRLENHEVAWLQQGQSMLNKIYVIGYLMHQYKIASSAKAIWAMEWKNNSEGVSNGRSGKSLMFQCFEKLGLAEMVTLPGRENKLTDNNHFMDRVSKKTDILVIDDARKGFDFDTFYTMITGSVTVNPKNEKSFELKYEDAPNIVFTSNFPIPNNDASTMARILFVAFSDYYHVMSDETDYKEDRRINYELGELFGDDYTEDEYNADINFFIDCLQFYLCCQKLRLPAIKPPMESINKRILRQKMGEGFLQWAREFFDRNGRFINHPVIRQAAYDDYCNSIERNAEKKTKNGWMQAIKCYVLYCDDIKCLNPENHPWYHEKDKRISANTTYRNATKTYELIYLQTTNCKDLSIDIVMP